MTKFLRIIIVIWFIAFTTAELYKGEITFPVSYIGMMILCAAIYIVGWEDKK